MYLLTYVIDPANNAAEPIYLSKYCYDGGVLQERFEREDMQHKSILPKCEVFHRLPGTPMSHVIVNYTACGMPRSRGPTEGAAGGSIHPSWFSFRPCALRSAQPQGFPFNWRQIS